MLRLSCEVGAEARHLAQHRHQDTVVRQAIGVHGAQLESSSRACICKSVRVWVVSTQYAKVYGLLVPECLPTQTQTDPSTGNMVANSANVCMALDLLTFLLQVLPHPLILAGLHKGLSICMTCGNPKVRVPHCPSLCFLIV